jgi:predicted nucleic acid-binding protein
VVRRTHLAREGSDCGKDGAILEGQCQLKRQPISAPDGLIAATALEHIVVTRNVKDFAGLGVEILNPWDT